jgi:hypothetical protein
MEEAFPAMLQAAAAVAKNPNDGRAQVWFFSAKEFFSGFLEFFLA